MFAGFHILIYEWINVAFPVKNILKENTFKTVPRQFSQPSSMRESTWQAVTFNQSQSRTRIWEHLDSMWVGFYFRHHWAVFRQDLGRLGWVIITSYLASLSQQELTSPISLSSRSSLLVPFLTSSVAALTFPSVLLLIWSLIQAFNDKTTIITGWIGDCSVCFARELTLAK